MSPGGSSSVFRRLLAALLVIAFAGSITAAQFLQRYANDVPWAHIDVAGMVWTLKPGRLWDKGATGYGVRLLDRYVRDNFEG